MKKLLLFFTLSICINLQNNFAQNSIKTATTFDEIGDITTDNSTAWTAINTVSIDVTGVKYVLLAASINMRPDGAHVNGREVNYNIYNNYDGNESGVIKRQIIRNSEALVESWGIGTLVHIFNTDGISGSKTYTLEHSNRGASSSGRNVFSRTRLTAIALTNNLADDLSNSVKRLSIGVNTTSATYSAVTGLTTDAITLPIAGDIYVAASVNSRANGGGSVAEYKLEYSDDNGSNWADLGTPVKRSMVNTYDDGMVSLVGVLQNQAIGSQYLFRVAHRRTSGSNTITTNNANLVAIALSNLTGHYPSFYSEIGATGVDITGVSTTETEVTSSTFTAEGDITGVGPGLYVHAQYLVSAAGLNEGTPQRMRARNQLFLDDGINPEIAADAYFRYISDNSSFGSGGFIGLAEDLTEMSSCTVKMKHGVEYISSPDAEDETLTTSEVILAGFQTYEKTGAPLGIEEDLLAKEFKIFGSQGTIEIRTEKPMNAKVNVYNIFGQLLNTTSLNNETIHSISTNNYKGIAIISIITNEGLTLNKRIILW